MKINKRAGYAFAVALTLALTPLVLAMPAVAKPCGPIGSVFPVLVCPPSQPGPTATPAPAPTASTPARPTTPAPTVPPAPVPTAPTAPGSSPAPAAGQQATVAPAADRGTTPPAAGPTSSATASTAAAILPEAPKAAAPPTASQEDGRSFPGPLLLVFGGVLLMVWSAIGLRRRA